jgi:hypothetical protein
MPSTSPFSVSYYISKSHDSSMMGGHIEKFMFNITKNDNNYKIAQMAQTRILYMLND